MTSQRACPVMWIPGFFKELFDRTLGQVHRYVFLSKWSDESLNLCLGDLAKVFPGEGVENNKVVQAVNELWS